MVIQRKYKKLYFQELREIIGLTRRQLGEKLKVSYYTIVAYENFDGKTNMPRCMPSFATIYKLLQLVKKNNPQLSFEEMLKRLAKNYE